MGSIKKAYPKIKGMLESGEFALGSKLPSLQKLARQFGISRASAWKLVSRLRQEGLVHTHERGAIIAGPAGTIQVVSSNDVAAKRGLLRDRIKVDLGHDILLGKYPEALLPPVTKLAARYGVAVSTLYKSLALLVADGLVRQEGRKYRQVRGRFRTLPASIVFVSRTDPSGVLDVEDLRTQSLIQSFERESPRVGYDPVCKGFSPSSAAGVLDFTVSIKPLREIAGFIVNIWNPWDASIWQRWLDLLTLLAQKDIPVVIVDLAGDLTFPADLLRKPKVRILRISSVKAGIRVAEALHRRGHHRVAFVSRDMNFEWVRARYEGVANYFNEYGGKNSSVTLFTQDLPVTNFELIFSLLKLDEEGVHALHFKQFSEDRIRELYPLIKKVKALQLAGAIQDPDLLRTLGPVIGLLKELENRDPDPRIIVKLQGLVGIAASDRGQALLLTRLFKTVLEKSDVTAWVCSSDQIALAALWFLRREKIPVPERLSIIGFDNWREAYENQLSTFDFNMDGMIKEALLMTIDAKELRSTPSISEVDGYVVERWTTRR